MNRVIRGSTGVLAGLLCAGTLHADSSDDGMVWAVDGDDNTVYLVGSIHLLRPADYPLPSTVQLAYDDAEALLMEIDMDDRDAGAAALIMMQRGQLSDGQTLEAVLEDDYAEAIELAGTIGIDLARMDSLAPWFAALSIEQLVMMREGFDPTRASRCTSPRWPSRMVSRSRDSNP